MSGYIEVMDNFEQELSYVLNAPAHEMERALKGIHLCHQTLTTLRERVEKDDFETLSQEVHFFKKLKPCVMSYLIYFTELRSCEMRKPKAGKHFQVKFYEKEIKKINKFFFRNTDFVHYMELNHNYLDHQLFTRNHPNDFPLIPNNDYYQNPNFCTSHDLLCAKIKAMHRLLQYIGKSLEGLGTEEQKVTSQNNLTWTSSKTALIELIYALYSNGAINHGAVELTTITSSFEDFFNIKLDNFYKTYSEIKARKGSKTKFLEELMFRLQQKISNEDSL